MVAMITADCVLSLDGQLEEGEMPGGGEDGEEMFTGFTFDELSSMNIDDAIPS